MAILPGLRLGPYEILSAIGAGGMGEVYRAKDTRLNRIVAIKVLPPHLADSSELRERFEREARTIASLNHPHICTLHDIGHQDGTDFLVMEYLEGETLAQRLEKGPLPLDQVLHYAIEIADALDKAHRKGVTHRDLKPGNIMLTKSGTKLLDFGLAKLKQEVTPANVQLSQLPTANEPLTAQGTIVGTLQYMAPEQLEGKEVDARTDIFAFGAVVYEMATGKRAFEGKSQASLIAAIMHVDPPCISVVQPMTPPSLDRVVRRCLAKEPDERWQSANDLTNELKWIAEGGSQVTSVPTAAVKGIRPRWRGALLWGVTSLLLAAIVGLAVWTLKPSVTTGSQAVTRLTVALPPGEELVVAAFPAIALSPDGTQLVYIARRGGIQQLYVRSMDSPEGKAISGTEGASAPFFSPDGQWVGFFAEQKLKKVPITGGSSMILCDSASSFGGSWGPNDTIFFAPTGQSGLWQVSAMGGTPQPFTKLDRQKGEISHRWPQVLPGGKAVLFTAWTGPGWDESQIEVQALGGGERRALIQGDYGYYVPTGHLVYSRRGTGTLMAVPFDLARLEVAGSAPVAVADRVLEGSNGATHYSLSGHGLLAYVPGIARQSESRMVWVDRNGKVEPLAAPPRAYQAPRLSPDGQQVAVTAAGAKEDLWLYNLARGTFTRLTSEASSQVSTWTPDGKRVAYRVTRAGLRNLFWRMADGSGAEERLTTGEGGQTPGSWSPDGQALVFMDVPDIWIFRLSDRKQQPFLKTQFNKFAPMFSPDGHWLVYASDESGRLEIYVQPYPGPGGKWQVSIDGGTEPVWNHNGREIFYRNGDQMMSVSLTTQPSFSASKPKMLFVLFEGQTVPLAGAPNYDVSPDGQRFLMLKPNEQEQPPTQINVVLNWFEELKQRVPVGKK